MLTFIFFLLIGYSEQWIVAHSQKNRTFDHSERQKIDHCSLLSIFYYVIAAYTKYVVPKLFEVNFCRFLVIDHFTLQPKGKYCGYM